MCGVLVTMNPSVHNPFLIFSNIFSFPFGKVLWQIFQVNVQVPLHDLTKPFSPFFFILLLLLLLLLYPFLLSLS